jgi:DNA mismatch endonuclease (patch repair protein)
MDRFSKIVRSAIMSRIRGEGNAATEESLAAWFRKTKIHGWRRHQVIHLNIDVGATASDGTVFKGSVRPDFAFLKHRVVLFIDGCFWHGCPKCYRSPKTRRRFWYKKVQRNRERDTFQTRVLTLAGWRVIRVWECSLKKRPRFCLAKIFRALEQPSKKGQLMRL